MMALGFPGGFEWIIILLILGVPAVILFVVLRLALKRDAHQQGVNYCRRCGHDLRHHAAAACPECGEKI